jgi:endonuclease/exonuclease/phosphatase (EEP) superfamily protein YafD
VSKISRIPVELILATALFLPWGVGQVFRDQSWATGLCFYLPSPLVACGLLLVAVRSWRHSRRRTAFAVALLALAPFFFIAGIENQWTNRTPAGTSGDIRLVHWNIMHGTLGWSRVRERLVDAHGDFYLVSEMPADKPLEPLLAELGPDFVGVRIDSMAVLARGSLAARALPTDSGKVQAFYVTWTWHGRELGILAVDLPSRLSVARDPLLKEVRALMLVTRPDLVLGDFNAPRRSAVLADLPAGYEHAYGRAGSGWGYTWPVPIPLWAIDQCLVGPRVIPRGYELHSTAASDHRLQFLRFALRSEE